MYRTLLLILSGTGGEALLSLLRNLTIAALIPTEDYGIAATFAMAMSVVEMISSLGMQQQIIQAKNGEDPAFQAGLQGFNLLRGVIAGTTLFFAAGWIAAFLQIPDVAWAYQMLAIVPILNGLQHFDIHRLKRGMRHGPEIAARTLPVALTLALVWPLSIWLLDYRVMLIVILLQFALMLLISHHVAERPFRLSFDKPVICAALQFGWPLLINNILLFMVFNGEKLIVGRELGMETLGILAMGFTLTLTPTLVLARVAHNFFLPQLSALQDAPARFTEMAVVTFQAVIAATLAFLGLVVFLGGPFVAALLGEKYAALVPLMSWLAILQSVRVLKAGSSIVALARGHTSNPMWANMARLLALPAVWIVAAEGVGLTLIIWIAIVGEILGFVVALTLLKWQTKLDLSALLLSLGATVAMIVLAGWIAITHTDAQIRFWPSTIEGLVFAVFFGLSLWTLKPLWLYLRRRQVVRFGS